jgi:hypothetical protein
MELFELSQMPWMLILPLIEFSSQVPCHVVRKRSAKEAISKVFL